MMRIVAGLALTAALAIVAFSAAAQDTIASFPPPAQYTSNPAKPFEALLAADEKWLKTKITDRKRKRRFQENNLRLPGADKKQIQPLVDQLEAELKQAESDMAVLKARHPDEQAQKDVVKAHVNDWIKALGEKAENLRKDAAEAAQRAKTSTKQFDIARAQADVDDDKKGADEADKEAKALADDLKAAGLS
jgi:hypothetical protein